MKNQRDKTSQHGPVVIKRDPVQDRSRQWSACRLTMFSPARSRAAYHEELAAVADTLGSIKQRFVVRCVGVGANDELLQSMSLPANVDLIGDGDQDGPFVHNGEVFEGGWHTLAESPYAEPRQLSPTELSLIRLLSLVTQDAELEEIADTIKLDPSMQYNLLRYLSSGRVGIHSYGGFRSFEQAVMLLGYRQFARWLSMFLLSANVEPASPTLYRNAITRGRHMELMAKQSAMPANELDSVFVTGAFSMIDRILGAPIESILAPLRLDEAVTEALLKGEGRYAPLLRFVMHCESGTESDLYAQAEAIGIATREANIAMLQGIQYASDIDAED